MARVVIIAILLLAKPVLAEECRRASPTPQRLTATYVNDTTVEIGFVEAAVVTGYEVRYLIADVITEDNFETGTLVDAGIVPAGRDATQTFDVETDGFSYYTFGIRAVGPCPSQVATVDPWGQGCVCGCASAGAGESAMLAGFVALLVGRRRRSR